MEQHARIYVAGHRGLVGSAIVRKLIASGHDNLLLRSHGELDLARQEDVARFFAEEKPEYVFIAAARVGGIRANAAFPADFIYDNLRIQNNIIHEAWQQNVRRLLFLGSSCIYPKHAPQPIREEFLLTGPLEITNRAYAVAKIAGIELCWSYNRQYGTKFFAAMPTNLYGPGDNYDLHQSHVIPALIRKMHEAKIMNAKHIEIWGTGTARREFLSSDDAAAACVHLMTLPLESIEQSIGPDAPPLFNIGCGSDLTILELTKVIAEIVGIDVEIVCNPAEPDGTPRKLLDTSRLNSLGWSPVVPLKEGLRLAYNDFLIRYESADRMQSCPAERTC